ncbi:MAG: phosphate ABC transporter permease subunit PstC [Elusimicrobia bacterium CG08_land_8_20_14_0_20_51_18]|nr:MAG: phosphate ABC transporter permease subunit PstC [Elusimicrobia bacterium CG08_land_8_20_14_0_20_51_18]
MAKKGEKIKEKLIEYFLFALSLASLVFLAGIVVTLFRESLPAFRDIGFFRMIAGRDWYPTYDPPDFGILPLIAGSFLVTLISILISVPLGLAGAVYISELAGKKEKAFLKPALELLSSIPSVVYGFWGMVFLAPFLQKHLELSTGYCALAAGIVLGIMSTPIIASLSEDALNYVPRAFKEASYALGANRWETVTRVIIPSAASGIITSVILGTGRAIGETMVVLMISGGSAILPQSFLEPVRPMTSAIAAEMGEAAFGTPHYHSLFAIALILFGITFVLNLAAEMIAKKFRLKLGASR